MSRFLQVTLLYVLINAFGQRASGQVTHHWTAISHTAYAITGDIESRGPTLTIAGHVIELHLVRKFRPDELSQARKMLSASLPDNALGAMYKINLLPSAKLIGDNTICGKKAATYLVLITSTEIENPKIHDLNLGFFSGDQPPNLTPSVLQSSREFCGTYWYQRTGDR